MRLELQATTEETSSLRARYKDKVRDRDRVEAEAALAAIIKDFSEKELTQLREGGQTLILTVKLGIQVLKTMTRRTEKMTGKM